MAIPVTTTGTLPEYFPQQFSTNYTDLIQQTQAELEDTVTPFLFDAKEKDIKFGAKLDWHDDTGPRMAPTVLNEYNLGKRWVKTYKGKVDPIGLDEWDEDLLAEIASPRSEIMKNMAAGYNRYKTRKIMDAIEGSAWEGLDGADTAVALTSSHVIAHGSTGLTFAKVTNVNKLAAKADVQGGQLYWCISPEDEEYLITNITELRDKTNTFVPTLPAGGSIIGMTWMGINWRRSNLLTTAVEGSTHTAINTLVWAKNCVMWNPGKQKLAVEVRADLDGAIQFRQSARMGGARSQDAGVFVVKTYY